MLPLREWESFYVIVGSAAGALIGLQFVAMALIADLPGPTSDGGIEAFGTPTILHFGTALFIAAVLSAPWHSPTPLAVVLGVAGTGGFAYSFIVARRARRQSDYQPVLEDWIFHVVLPAIGYGTIAVSAYILHLAATAGLFAIASATLLLIFVAIHNAWDSVAYLVSRRTRERDGQEG